MPQTSPARAAAAPFDAVLYLGFGGPTGLDEIRPFLANVLRGRRIPPARIEAVAHHYERFGGVSPITEITERQARALEAALRGRGLALPVRVGARNWRPMLGDTCRALHAAGARRILAADCRGASQLFQLRAVQAEPVAGAGRAGCGRHRAVRRGLRARLAPRHRRAARHLRARRRGARDAARAAARQARAWCSRRTRSRRRWRPRTATCCSSRDSATAVASLQRAHDWALVYQSRSGRPEDPWLEPDVNDYLREARAGGLEAAILVPIGFLADHVEVLYDLDVEARATADDVGLALARAEAVNDHPRFIEALADVVCETVARYGRGRPLSIVPAEAPAKRELPPPVRPAAALYVEELARDGCRGAVLVEGGDEVVGDHLGRPALDLVALHQIDELAALEDADRGRRRWIAGEVPAGAIGGCRVGAGEDRRRDVRRDGVVEGEGDAGPGLAGGAPAHRVDDNHQRSRGRLDRLVDRIGRPQFLDTQAGQFVAHGRHEIFGVGHVLFSLPRRGVIKSQPTMTLLPRRSTAAALLSAAVCLCPGALMAQTPALPPDPTAPPRDPSARPPAVAPATGLVRGRIVAADTGLPLRRVTVSLRSTSDERGGQETDTDAAGAFAFEAVPKGRYRLKASKARYVDTSLGARVTGGPGRAFDVGDSQKIEGLTIRLAVAGVITGRILDDAGEPVAGAPVIALQRKRVRGQSRLTPSAHARATDDIGTYRLFGLAPGRYYLSVLPDERHRSNVGVVNASPTRLAATYHPSTPVAGEAQPIDVAAGTETTVDITLSLTQVTTVSGEVVDSMGRAPIAGVIHLMSPVEEGSGYGFAGMQTMNKSGAFTLSGVAPGDYTLLVRAFFDEAQMMRVATSGVGEGGAFTMPLSVSGAAISDLRIVVPPPIEIAGRVHFEGEPPGGGPSVVTVLVSSTAEQMHDAVQAQVGADGRFSLHLQSGSWQLTAWAPGGWMVKRLGFRGRIIEPGAPVDITGEPDAKLDVLLTSQVTVVTGTASDTEGGPLVDYHAVVFPAEEKSWLWDHRTRRERADAHGRFRIEGLLPGDYFVAVASDIDPNEALDEELLAALRPGATRVRVRDGQTETLALKLAPLP